MAYEKQNWECGQVITADKLNHMEDGIAAGGDCDCGFECETTTTLLTNETVTTASQGISPAPYATLAYSELISAETIKVTLNGTEYECPRVSMGGGYLYGASWNQGATAPDFSQYPFAISSKELGGNMLLTESVGTYTVEVEAILLDATMTPCFKSAVQSVAQEMIPTYRCLTEDVPVMPVRHSPDKASLFSQAYTPTSAGVATISVPNPNSTVSTDLIALQGYHAITSIPDSEYDIKEIYYDEPTYKVKVNFSQTAVDLGYTFKMQVDVIMLEEIPVPTATIRYLSCGTSPK